MQLADAVTDSGGIYTYPGASGAAGSGAAGSGAAGNGMSSGAASAGGTGIAGSSEDAGASDGADEATRADATYVTDSVDAGEAPACSGVDTQNDPSNCGSCGFRCLGASDEKCVRGACVCVAPAVLCGAGQCVDVQTDPANCGVCGRSCEGNPCAGGNCQVTVIAENRDNTLAVNDFVVDSASVIWTSSKGVYRKALTPTGDMYTLGTASGGGSIPSGVATFGGSVYWADLAGIYVAGVDPMIGVRPFHPSDLWDAAASAQPVAAPLAVAVDAANVYWVDFSLGGVFQQGRTAGSPTIPLATGQDHPYAIAVDESQVYWINRGGSPGSGSVSSVPIASPTQDGGAPVSVLAAGETQPFALAIDAQNVYFTEDANATGSVKSVPKAAGTDGGAPRILASNLDAPRGVAVDDYYVYWTNYDDGTVEKVPVSGGPPLQIGVGDNPKVIVVDAKNVYWANDSAGTIVKIAK